MLNFCQDNVFENIACKIFAILSLPRHINDFFLHIFLPHVCRGVFQTLSEKHFPALDRKKTGYLFSLSGIFDSPAPSSKAAVGSKGKQDAGEL